MKQRNRTTIYDIARALNLSPSTISRALQHHPLINALTRERVQQLAEEMGYVPNWIASSLRKRRSNIIGLIVPRTSVYFQSTAISGVQHIAHRHGYSIVIGQSEENMEMERELAKTFFSLRVDGLLAVSSMFTPNADYLSPYVKNNIPVVLYDRIPNGFTGHSITGDDFHGGFLATEHLIHHDCKNIMHITGELTCNLYQQRLDGYKAALRKYQIPFNQNNVHVCNLTLETATEIAEEIFSTQVPDGIFTANDTAAIAFIQTAHKLGISIPQQVKVVGYSNDLSSRIVSPSLTTIEQSGYKMGEKAAETLIRLLNNELETESPVNYIFDVELIARNSTAYVKLNTLKEG
ncbi:LacI family transcriptional regulator [Chitinophaga costaii]|uniref:LacI family transcriptional regulator n=1 Tax=Chitinophaga costaii TaxID=1335309 RepID=A0A1C4FZZ6_9BACT|nr:LacI family DNA-binding transcriptional regulator [Chitinophaga costaii]PUZ19982.1 LacI family transcriptional regulator [Chitinophaga costaii]SCC61520.1 LacI family transcriptional regulator [Chitinophaga costaii]